MEILNPEIDNKNKKDAPRCTDHFSDRPARYDARALRHDVQRKELWPPHLQRGGGGLRPPPPPFVGIPIWGFGFVSSFRHASNKF